MIICISEQGGERSIKALLTDKKGGDSQDRCIFFNKKVIYFFMDFNI